MVPQQRHDVTGKPFGSTGRLGPPGPLSTAGRAVTAGPPSTAGRAGTTSTRGTVRRADDGDTGSRTVVNGSTSAGGAPQDPVTTAGPPPDGGGLPGAGTVAAATAYRSGPLLVSPSAATAGDLLARYLQAQATSFLRGLSLRAESETDADTLLCGSARRIAGVLHTYGALTDESWAEPLRAELGWLAATLGREREYTSRLDRLLEALRRLSTGVDVDGAPSPALGAARAAALLERQLTLARTRAHSATLQAMGSSRFHGLADAIAVLASEVPLTSAAGRPAAVVLPPMAATARARLTDAAAALPLHRAGHPYNAEAVQAALGAELTSDLQDAPWHQVRVLLRLSRYAAEVPGADDGGGPRLAEAAALLRRHHEAAESASAVAAAARTPRIAPATAYALGVLHADQRHEVEAARFAFSRLWQPEPAGAGRAEPQPAVPGARGE